MEAIVTSIVSALSPSALPLVVVIVVGLYFYFQLKNVESDRLTTKEARDKDSLELHDKVLNLEFRSTQNKDNISLLFEQVSDSNKQIALLNTQLATVLTKMDSVIDTLRELKDEVKSK